MMRQFCGYIEEVLDFRDNVRVTRDGRLGGTCNLTSHPFVSDFLTADDCAKIVLE